MHNIADFDTEGMRECAAVLRKAGQDCSSMEDVTKNIVRHLYNNLGDGNATGRACALVRFYKTHRFVDLDENLASFAKGLLGALEVPAEDSDTSDMKCLTLLATAGEKPEWNSREMSQGHKAIPLPSEEVVGRLPMIVNLIKQLGLELNHVVKPDPAILLRYLSESESKESGVFFVADALGSEYIPAQEEFVVPYGIKSVVGFGGLLPAGDMFAVIVFSKVAIVRQTANLFKMLALEVKTAILPFETTVFSR